MPKICFPYGREQLSIEIDKDRYAGSLISKMHDYRASDDPVTLVKKAMENPIGTPALSVMAEADIISVHIPLTPETRGLIGKKEIAIMKEGAILINTARGPVVDDKALAAALKIGRIKAGTDVFEKDPPLPEGHPLRDVPNLIRTPHVGFDTIESIDRRAAMVFANVEEWLKEQSGN